MTHGTTTTSLTENQKLAIYMENVYNRILGVHPNVKVMLVSKNSKYLKTNYPQNKGLSVQACILSFTDKVQLVMNKLFPDEPIDNVRIRGKKDEIVVKCDDLFLDIIVISTDKKTSNQ